jgi:hypothetical protein
MDNRKVHFVNIRPVIFSLIPKQFQLCQKDKDGLQLIALGLGKSCMYLGFCDKFEDSRLFTIA